MIPEYIPDNDMLYRRIPPWHFKPDGSISSAAFNGEKTSVDWEKYTTPEKTLAVHQDFRLASIMALIPRQLNQEVNRDPLPDNLAHSLIIEKKQKQ